jgi:hypothetical protein
MNEQQLAAVKQAVEAMELHAKQYPHMQKGYTVDAITALQSIISQDALYKMAEDAVTIGLSYNDWPKIGCVNHDCDQCKAAQPARVQDPVEPSNVKAALCFALWHHMGASSQIGQPIRKMLGLGQHDHLSAFQFSEARRINSVLNAPPAAPVPLTDDQVDAATKAWFENDIVAGRNPFRKRMRAAFAAAHKITEKGD